MCPLSPLGTQKARREGGYYIFLSPEPVLSLLNTEVSKQKWTSCWVHPHPKRHGQLISGFSAISVLLTGKFAFLRVLGPSLSLSFAGGRAQPTKKGGEAPTPRNVVSRAHLSSHSLGVDCCQPTLGLGYQKRPFDLTGTVISFNI